MGFNPRAFQEGRQQQLEGRRRSQERAADPIDERILQEKEATLTSLLKEAKIISQESDQLQVMCHLSRYAWKSGFHEDEKTKKMVSMIVMTMMLLQNFCLNT